MEVHDSQEKCNELVIWLWCSEKNGEIQDVWLKVFEKNCSRMSYSVLDHSSVLDSFNTQKRDINFK